MPTPTQIPLAKPWIDEVEAGRVTRALKAGLEAGLARVVALVKRGGGRE